MSTETRFDADVLVIGAGPVGLSCAIELGSRGSTVMLAERDAVRGPQPRAKTLNMRSLEHFRRWGVADAVRAASPVPDDLPTDVIFQTRLYGSHIATLPNIYFRGNIRQHDPRFSEPSEWIPQHIVEQVLKRKIDSLAEVATQYGRELIDFEQDEAGVTSRLKGADDDIVEIRSRYLIGADGARSRVRDGIGARMAGRHAYAANYNMVLRIPELNADPPSPRGIMHWTVNAESPGVLGPIGDLWYAAKRLPPGVGAMSREEIGDFLVSTIGRPVDFEIVSVDPWYAHELIADRYSLGRVFLAGDACHLHPPFGGYGMNMGIADAVDLGWKMDGTLKGWAGPNLLRSYEFERRRVHQWTIDEAVENYRVLSSDLIRPGMEDDSAEGEAIRAALREEIIATKQREFHTIGLVLGYHYSGSPVIVGGETLPVPCAETYTPVAAPGALAPHAWLEPGVSLYDRFGPGFTLLDLRGDTLQQRAFRQSASSLGIPLEVLDLRRPDLDALYGQDLTLIRPDEHVAWRGDSETPVDASTVLARAAGLEAVGQSPGA